MSLPFHHISLALWFLFAGSLQSQQVDTTRINALLGEFTEILFQNPDSALMFGAEIEAAYVGKAPDLKLARCFLLSGQTHLYTESWEQSRRYFQKAARLSKKLDRPSYKAASWAGIGSASRNMGLYTDAVVYFRKSIHVYQQARDSLPLANVYNSLGNLFYEMSDFPRALRMYLKALRIQDLVGTAKNQFLAHLNIGEVYFEMGDPSLALEYVLNGENNVKKEEEVPAWQASLFLLKAKCLSSLTRYGEANDNFARAFKLGHKHQLIPNLIRTHAGKGEMFLLQENPDSARHYFYQGQIWLEKQEYYKEKALILDGLARTELLAGNKLKALSYASQALESASRSGKPALISKTSQTLADNAARNNDYQAAFQALKRKEEYLDSLRSGVRQRELGRLEVEFESNQRDVELAYLKEKEAHSQDVIERQRMLIIGILLALTLLIIIGILLFVGILRNKRFSKEMGRLNQEIRVQAVEIRKSRDELEKRVEERTLELRQSHQALQDREIQLSMILHSTEESIGLVEWVGNGDILIHTLNDGFIKNLLKRGLQVSRADLEGKSLRSFLSQVMKFPETEIEMWHENFQNVFKKGDTAQFEYLTEYPNGEHAIFDTSLVAIREENGEIKYGLYVAQDITEKKKSEEKLIATILETEDRERKRIAKELHDSLGQLLTASSLNLDAIREQIKTLDAKSQKKYQNALEFLTQAIRESRGISHNLMPKAIEDFGLVAAVESMLEGLIAATPARFVFYQNLEEKRLPYTLELALYRITQEAVTNILKYASAKEVIIQLMMYPDMVILTIDDDGRGFDPKELDPKNSFGITGMKNRVSSFGGVFSLDSGAGRGTLITIEIPLNMG